MPAQQGDNSQVRLARDMLRNAEEFRRAGIVLEGDQVNGESLDPHVAIPMTVLSAFATEMYLKFMIGICTRQTVPRTHNLETLFTKLPEGLRYLLKTRWENATPVELQMRNFRDVIAERPTLTFEEALHESALAFVEFRYHYESRGLVKGFSGDLTTAFRRVIEDVFPNEFAELHLPLPKGALHSSQQNTIRSASRDDPNPD